MINKYTICVTHMPLHFHQMHHSLKLKKIKKNKKVDQRENNKYTWILIIFLQSSTHIYLY